MIFGIMGAMPDEVDQLCAKLENVTVEPYGGVEYHKGTLAGKQVVVCCAGMGKANAAATTQVLITKFGAEKIIFSGIAGNMIQRAKELQMITVFRVFVIDSMALDSLLGVKNLRPDAIDILPGLMPGIIRKVRALTGLPVLAGGLITEKQEVLQALDAGALAISSTAPAVWQM